MASKLVAARLTKPFNDYAVIKGPNEKGDIIASVAVAWRLCEDDTICEGTIDLDTWDSTIAGRVGKGDKLVVLGEVRQNEQNPEWRPRFLADFSFVEDYEPSKIPGGDKFKLSSQLPVRTKRTEAAKPTAPNKSAAPVDEPDVAD